jgi:cytidine deaminase
VALIAILSNLNAVCFATCLRLHLRTVLQDSVQFVFGAGCHWDQNHARSRQASGGGGGSSSICSAGTSADVAASTAPLPQPRAPATYTLDQLLPAKFGPSDLMSEDQQFPLLLQPQDNGVELAPERATPPAPPCTPPMGYIGNNAGSDGNGSCGGDVSPGGVNNSSGSSSRRGASAAAAQLAADWANRCYTPYTRSPSGAAIVTRDGRLYGGGYVESVAFNPSLSPFQAAWAAAVADGVRGFEEVGRLWAARGCGCAGLVRDCLCILMDRC